MNNDYWSRITLGEFIELQRGYDLTHEERVSGSVPVVGAAGQNGYHNKWRVKGPGIVVGRSGGSFGKIHLVKQDYWPHNTAMFVKNFKGNDPYFVYYFLSNLDFSSFNSGSAQPSLNRNFINPIKISIPSPSLQTKISKVLYNLDSKIELNNKINAELEAMAKLIYDYWFVQFDFPISKEQAQAMCKPELEGKPYRASGGKMVYNTKLKREIPEGWTNVELSEIANIAMGQSPPGDSYNENGQGKIFYQGSTDFGDRYPIIRKYTTLPSRHAKEGDILLSVRAPVGTMNIAGDDCCIGRGLSALNSKIGAFGYLYEVMKNFKQVFDLRNSSGTTFGSITKDDLFSLKSIYSGDKLILEFEETVKPMYLKQNLIGKENQELASLRDWLLPMLMNGQVTIKEAEEQLSMAADGGVGYGAA